MFLTSDQNLRYQQNLPYAEVGVIVLIARTNRVEALQPLMPQVNHIVPTIQVGEVVETEA